MNYFYLNTKTCNNLLRDREIKTPMDRTCYSASVRPSGRRAPGLVHYQPNRHVSLYLHSFTVSQNKKNTTTFLTSTVVAAFPTTSPPLAFSSGDHLHFLRLEALVHLHDARLRHWSRACCPPLPSSLEPAPMSSSSPPPMAGDHEGVVAVPYFALASRLHALRCPSGRSSWQPSSWCSLLRHLPAPICPLRRLSSSSTRLTW
jgi:hypothetical protein